MKSCETKVTLSKVEHHLTTSHPDVYILFKRILMEQYGISKKKCDLCGFCFQTEADYESHLGTFFKKTSLSIGPPIVHHSHWSINAWCMIGWPIEIIFENDLKGSKCTLYKQRVIKSAQLKSYLSKFFNFRGWKVLDAWGLSISGIYSLLSKSMSRWARWSHCPWRNEYG